MKSAPNICAGPFGRLYDFYIERPRLMQAIGFVMWGMDASILYKTMEAIARADGGATIVDVPCGGGVAFSALQPDQDVRYFAGDLDEQMLARARRRAAARSLNQVEVAAADMTALPVADESVDLFVSFSGLHMLHEAELAVQEIARCLKPGGRLIGTTFLREGKRRQRFLFRSGSRLGHPEPPRYADLHEAFVSAGIAELVIEPRCGFAAFTGRKPAA
jgi:ubiquinone/menaquinone biosynthesis C-methylase UbiE